LDFGVDQHIGLSCPEFIVFCHSSQRLCALISLAFRALKTQTAISAQKITSINNCLQAFLQKEPSFPGKYPGRIRSKQPIVHFYSTESFNLSRLYAFPFK
jgi:hypothetical protein